MTNSSRHSALDAESIIRNIIIQKKSPPRGFGVKFTEGDVCVTKTKGEQPFALTWKVVISHPKTVFSVSKVEILIIFGRCGLALLMAEKSRRPR